MMLRALMMGLACMLGLLPAADMPAASLLLEEAIVPIRYPRSQDDTWKEARFKIGSESFAIEMPQDAEHLSVQATDDLVTINVNYVSPDGMGHCHTHVDARENSLGDRSLESWLDGLFEVSLGNPVYQDVRFWHEENCERAYVTWMYASEGEEQFKLDIILTPQNFYWIHTTTSEDSPDLHSRFVRSHSVLLPHCAASAPPST